MARLDQLQGRGFRFLVNNSNAPTISTKGGTAKLLSSPIGMGATMQEHGYWPKFNGVVELSRADFIKLRIKDRTVVEYRNNAANKLKVALRVIGIEDNGASATVKLTLVWEPGGKEG